MDYQAAYDNLIRTRKERVPVEGVYYERHHILPRSMGGTNDPENLVKLTAREHFLAHWLLWRIHRNRESAASFYSMCTFQSIRHSSNRQFEKKKTSSRAYVEAREAFIEKQTGRKQTFDTIAKRSLSLKGKKTFQPLHSEDAKRKIANSLKKSEDFFETHQEKLLDFPVRTQHVIKLYLSGMSAPEIAKVVSLSTQAVRSVIFSTKKKISTL